MSHFEQGKPNWRQAIAIAAAIFLPYVANHQLWPVGSAVCLLFVLIYIRQDRDRLASEEADRRQRENLCVNCGYDLRATRDRCPECGTEKPGG